MVYNGDPLWTWYRASLIDGHAALESTKPFSGAWSGVKPLATTCDCYRQIKRVGRFGRWQKGVLVHHAFAQAQLHIEEAEHAMQNL